jgi:hypothetical protein
LDHHPTPTPHLNPTNLNASQRKQKKCLKNIKKKIIKKKSTNFLQKLDPLLDALIPELLEFPQSYQ